MTAIMSRFRSRQKQHLPCLRMAKQRAIISIPSTTRSIIIRLKTEPKDPTLHQPPIETNENVSKSSAVAKVA